MGLPEVYDCDYRVASFPGFHESSQSVEVRQALFCECRPSIRPRTRPVACRLSSYGTLGRLTVTNCAGRGGAAGLSADNAGSVATWLFVLPIYPRSAQRGEGAPPRLAARRLRDKEARRGALCSDRGDRGGLSSASPRYRALCCLMVWLVAKRRPLVASGCCFRLL